MNLSLLCLQKFLHYLWNEKMLLNKVLQVEVAVVRKHSVLLGDDLYSMAQLGEWLVTNGGIKHI